MRFVVIVTVRGRKAIKAKGLPVLVVGRHDYTIWRIYAERMCHAHHIGAGIVVGIRQISRVTSLKQGLSQQRLVELKRN